MPFSMSWTMAFKSRSELCRYPFRFLISARDDIKSFLKVKEIVMFAPEEIVAPLLRVQFFKPGALCAWLFLLYFPEFTYHSTINQNNILIIIPDQTHIALTIIN